MLVQLVSGTFDHYGLRRVYVLNEFPSTFPIDSDHRCLLEALNQLNDTWPGVDLAALPTARLAQASFSAELPKHQFRIISKKDANKIEKRNQRIAQRHAERLTLDELESSIELDLIVSMNRPIMIQQGIYLLHMANWYYPSSAHGQYFLMSRQEDAWQIAILPCDHIQ